MNCKYQVSTKRFLAVRSVVYDHQHKDIMGFYLQRNRNKYLLSKSLRDEKLSKQLPKNWKRVAIKEGVIYIYANKSPVFEKVSEEDWQAVVENIRFK